MPLSMLRLKPRGVTRKTQGQDGVAFSFPVGLFHPLQHAGLSRRTPGSDSNCGSLVVFFRLIGIATPRSPAGQCAHRCPKDGFESIPGSPDDIAIRISC
jgi:hypothetical protein